MPVCKWQIQPTNLVFNGNSSNVVHNLKDFTDISNEICCKILLQLSSLSKHAEDLFRELNSQATDICVRSIRLNSKVRDLKERSNQLNPTLDKVSLDDIILCKPFKSGRQLHGMGRPDSIVEAYSKLEPIPDLHLLNHFKAEHEVDCNKKYTDPNFFFLSWCGQIKQEVDKKPTRKKAPAKKKAEVTRKPQNLNLRKIQDRIKNEIIGGVSIATKHEGSEAPHEDILEPLKYRLSQISNLSKSSTLSVQEQIQQSEISCGMSELNLIMFKPPPPLSLDQLINKSEDDLDGDFMPLPPLPPAIEHEKRGTLYMIEDFNPDFLILPAPPLIQNFQPHVLHNESASSLPLTIPPLPPPLPLDLDKNCKVVEQKGPAAFTEMISNNAFNLKSVTSIPEKNIQVGRQSSSGKGDTRNDLLSSIRNGIKLRKVDEVRQETKDNSHEGVAGLFDVQMIMEMRRRALQDEDEDEDDDSECSWDE